MVDGAASASASSFRLTRDPNFLKYWAAETVSLLGSQITLLALPLVAVVTLHASSFEMGLLAACETLPILFLSVPLGVLTDRIRRRPLLVIANVARALLLATVPIAAVAGALTMPHLYAVALAAGGFAALFDTAYQAYLPGIIARGALVDANSKLAASRSLAQVSGPAAGGILVTVMTAPFAVALDAASFGLAAALVLWIARPEPAPAVERRWTRAGGYRAVVLRLRRHRSAWRDALEAVGLIVHHRLLFPLIAATGLANLLGGAVVALKVLFMARVLSLDSTTIGAVLAVQGAGALVGATAGPTLVRLLGAGRVLVWASAFFVAGDALLALTGLGPAPIFATLIASQAVAGVARSIYTAVALSVRQAASPLASLGRITAVGSVMSYGTLAIGALIGGALAQLVGIRPTLLAAAAALVLPLLWLAVSPVARLREQPPVAPAEVAADTVAAPGPEAVGPAPATDADAKEAPILELPEPADRPTRP